jgi:hypothetical protein
MRDRCDLRSFRVTSGRPHDRRRGGRGPRRLRVGHRSRPGCAWPRTFGGGHHGHLLAAAVHDLVFRNCAFCAFCVCSIASCVLRILRHVDVRLVCSAYPVFASRGLGGLCKCIEVSSCISCIVYVARFAMCVSRVLRVCCVCISCGLTMEPCVCVLRFALC